MSPTPSIRTSPAPGKDPPQAPPQTRLGARSSSAASSSQPLATEISSSQPIDGRYNDKDKDKDIRTMPPPSAPSLRPSLVPQTSSSLSTPRSTTFISTSSHSISTSRSNAQSQLHSLQTQNIKPSQLEVGSIEQIPSQIPQPPNLTPFFVLVDDPANKSTYHPHRVHYLFSDDEDTEVLTGALIRSMEGRHDKDEGASGYGKGENDSSSSETSSSGTRESHQKKRERKKKKREGSRRAGQKKKEERVLIVDINEKGDAVKSVNSFCERWQVLNAAIESAPTFDAQNYHDGADDTNRGLMLRIEGVGVESLKYEDGKGKGSSTGSGMALGDEDMRELLEGFDKKMEVLRKLVGEKGVEGLGVGVESGQVEGEGKDGDG